MAYEEYTYEYLLSRVLNRITTEYPNIDTREGSMIYNAVAPAALELAIMYTELENVWNEGFMSTASRWGKIEKCREQGLDIGVLESSPGKFQGEFNVEVQIGSRWNLDLHNYIVESYVGKNADGNHEYVMLCETYGSSANSVTGDLTPIDYTNTELKLAKITDCLIEGENEATDEEIDAYYYNHVNGRITDGNVAQYESWCEEFDGIGRYKIFPLWNGNNTVKVSVLSTSNEVASSELIGEFQNYLDPGENGMGDGVAPIGAFVTVSTASPVALSVKVSVIPAAGRAIGSIDDVCRAYFAECAYTTNTVKVLELVAKILALPWVDDITDYSLSVGETYSASTAVTGNYTLGDEQIPVFGQGVVTEVSR